jgi:TRAP-type uncharacterized transport system fused permease subunit
MSAIVVAIAVGVVAVGLVVGVVALSALVLGGTKVVSAVHDGGTWFANRLHRRQGAGR